LLLDQPQLQQEQVLEQQPLPRQREIILRRRVVDMLVHLLERRQVVPHIVVDEWPGVRQPVDQVVPCRVERGTRQLAHALLAYTLCQRVHGNQAAGRESVLADQLPFGVRELQATGTGHQCARNDDLGTLADLLRDVSAEPGDPDRSGSVEQPGLDAWRSDPDLAEIDQGTADRDVAPEPERIVESHSLRVVDVPARNHLQDVLHRLQAQAVLVFLDVLRADAGERRDQRVRRERGHGDWPAWSALRRWLIPALLDERSRELADLGSRAVRPYADERLDRLQGLADGRDVRSPFLLVAWQVTRRLDRGLEGAGDLVGRRRLGLEPAQRIDRHCDVEGEVGPADPDTPQRGDGVLELLRGGARARCSRIRCGATWWQSRFLAGG